MIPTFLFKSMGIMRIVEVLRSLNGEEHFRIMNLGRGSIV